MVVDGCRHQGAGLAYRQIHGGKCLELAMCRVSGERTHMPEYPQEGTLRGGHIPSAASIPWAKAVREDSTFKSADELRAIYLDQKRLDPGKATIAYCRIGERSSHTWFVLKYLLGFKDVKNYDGSWTEYGNLIGVPVEKGG